MALTGHSKHRQACEEPPPPKAGLGETCSPLLGLGACTCFLYCIRGCDAGGRLFEGLSALSATSLAMAA